MAIWRIRKGIDHTPLIRSRFVTSAGAAYLIAISMAASFTVEAVVRDYHTHTDIWAASLGEELPCQREPSNRSDRFAVAVLKLERLWAIFPERYRAFALCTSASLDLLSVVSRDHGDILMTFR